MIFAAVLGDAEALTDDDTEDDGLGLRLSDALTDDEGVGLGDADREDDGDGDRLTDALGLLIISRTATCTAARSSEVAFENPTERAPCPAVVSRTTCTTRDPKSMLATSVLLAPGAQVFAAVVVETDPRPELMPANRTLFDPGDPSVTDCSAQVPSSWRSVVPASWILVSVEAVTVIATAYITSALFVRLTTTALVP